MMAGDDRRRPVLLLVDDDRRFTDALELLLKDDFDMRAAHDGTAALAEFESRMFDAVLLDIDLREPPDGMEVLDRIRRIDPRVPVFMVTRTEQPEVALEAGRRGATDYFTKGRAIEVLVGRLRAALVSQVEARLREAYERSQGATAQFVGESESARRLRSDARTVAQVDSTVLITGPCGSGKEVLARYLHEQSPRCGGPLLAVNCAAIAPSLVEDELFGHDRGAFTGAEGERHGLFELARGGSLFLDEITEMPLGLQPKLLRVLQFGEFTRLGSERQQHADVRVICSTNRDPQEAVASGRLRQDLYYRVHVVRLDIPPLRERREDILPLARHFLDRKARELGRPVAGLTPEAEQLLLSHDWPGNARELENLIERAMVFCRGDRITPDLLEPIAEGAPYISLAWNEAREEAMRRFERSYLRAMLRVHAGSVTGIAEATGLSRQAVYKALARAGLDPETFRPR